MSQSYTPSQLLANASFPTRSPVLSMGGTRLDFGAGSGFFEVLLDLPLTAAGALNSGSPYAIYIAVDSVRLSLDSDFTIGVADASSFIGVIRADVNNTQSGFEEGAYTSTHLIPTAFSLGNLGITVEQFSLSIALSDITSVEASIGGLTDSYTSSRILNRSQDLHLVIMGDGPDELYGVRSLQVQVSQVPEPPVFFLVLLALPFALGICKRNAVRRIRKAK